MTLAETLRSTPWEVIGSDISTQVLAKASNGNTRWNARTDCRSPCSVDTASRASASRHLIDKSLRQRVSLQVNLIEPCPIREFDVIFLRNVMIYFDQETKRKWSVASLPFLRRGGYFMISHSESLNGVSDAFKLVAPSIYQKP